MAESIPKHPRTMRTLESGEEMTVVAHMQIPKLEDGTLATLALILVNPDIQAVVIDRQPGLSPFVMAFSVSWNSLRQMVEQRESLATVLVIGGPVEGGES